LLVSKYNEFVGSTDQTAKASDRVSIALYGILGEIGSLISVIKKHLVHGNDEEIFSAPTEEIREELGDLIWYCFLYARLRFEDGKLNILTQCIEEISKELRGESNHNETHKLLFIKMITEARKDEFLSRATEFEKLQDFTFDQFQELAFLTARTQKKQLLEVCLAVIPQLGAELMREKLPKEEKTLHPAITDRDKHTVLGEMAWHISAISSLFGVSLNKVIEDNCRKINFRKDKTSPTDLHDAFRDDIFVFPRQFKISFLTIGHRRSRMYFKNKPLGDDLTDNSYDDDGYRFHDVLHLANAAHLGWSPVLRALMKLKRKSPVEGDMEDEVEDGARARIVEEAVIKAMHMEGERTAKLRDQKSEKGIVPLFAHHSDISFSFLKFLHNFSKGLEVEKNKYWEWENALNDGFKIYHQLRLNGQGTVTVDLNNRKIYYDKEVYIDITGSVVGIGTCIVKTNLKPLRNLFNDKDGMSTKLLAAKKAVLASLKLEHTSENLSALKVYINELDQLCIEANTEIQKIIWSQKIITFKATFSEKKNSVNCTVIALSDPKDS